MNTSRMFASRWGKAGSFVVVSGSFAGFLLVKRKNATTNGEPKPSVFERLKFATASMEARQDYEGSEPVLPLFEDRYFKITQNTKRASISLSTAISHAREVCSRVKDETGSPGMTIAVSLDGELVYAEGFGYADIEQRVKCVPDTVMRIASISKSITMAIVAKLVEENKLDLDKPIQEYVKDFPEKEFDGEKVTLTTRQLVSHLGGIRHYEKKEEIERKKTEAEERKKGKKKMKAHVDDDEFALKEYHLKDEFKSINDSLKLFKDDELINKPGSEFLYTTHGWTLISAVVEAVCQKPFPRVAEEYFHILGLERTYLDRNSPIIYGRSRYYVKDDHGRLKNAPYVNNSYKWAGGGFVSTVEDLVKFGNAMLYSYQKPDHLFGKPAYDRKAFLKQSTIRTLWSPVANTKLSWDKDGAYGMGWGVVPSQENFRFGNSRQFCATHTGGAIGASSVLFVLPEYDVDDEVKNGFQAGVGRAPTGVVVAIIANMGKVGLNAAAQEIARAFAMTR